VVLSIAMWAIFRMRRNLQAFVKTAEAVPSIWPRWQRHEHQFEDHPDPRRDLLLRWQRRYVESGDWNSLWSYLMGLLCRSDAPPEDVRAVIRPLRESTLPAKGRGFLRGRGDADTEGASRAWPGPYRVWDGRSPGRRISRQPSTRTPCGSPPYPTLRTEPSRKLWLTGCRSLPEAGRRHQPGGQPLVPPSQRGRTSAQVV
jgi:hypothetical protein